VARGGNDIAGSAVAIARSVLDSSTASATATASASATATASASARATNWRVYTCRNWRSNLLCLMRCLMLFLVLAPVALLRPPLPAVHCHVYWIADAPCEVCRYSDGSMELCGIRLVPAH